MNKKIWIILAAVAVIAAIVLGVMFAGKNGEVTDLQAQIEGLNTKVSELTKQIENAPDAAALKAQIDDLTAKLAAAPDGEALQAKIDSLTAELATANEALAAAKAELEALTKPVEPVEPSEPAVPGEPSAYSMPEMNTTDPIELTFMTWDDYELTQALIDQFMEKYPNITVTMIQTTTADCTAQLTNMAAEGNLPDVYFWLDLDPLLANPYMMDITEYIENDEEAQTKLYPSLRRVGYVDGKRCYFMPGENLPAIIYLDKAVFDKLGKELPAQDWTWEEMMDMIDNELTDPTQGIWAYNFFMGPVTLGPIALTDNVTGEFGWDGESYNFGSGWVEMVEKQTELARQGKQAINGSEEYLAVVPDDMWAGEAGHVAIQMDAYWTMNNIYTQAAALERGLQMVPYNSPVGADVENGGQFSWLDMVSISYTCEHPREAYELAKFLTWGKEGWLARAELYPTITNANGDIIYRLPGSLPMIEDEEVGAAMAAIMPDLGYWNDWEAFFAAIQNPVTFGGRTIPGFNAFVNDYYHGSDFNGHIGIETAIRENAVDPYDYTDTLDAKGREYYDATMEAFYAVYGQAE